MLNSSPPPPKKTRDCPPKFLSRKFELVRVLGVDSQPCKSEYLPDGDVANPVTYALTFRTSPKTKPMLLKKPVGILLTLSDLEQLAVFVSNLCYLIKLL